MEPTPQQRVLRDQDLLGALVAFVTTLSGRCRLRAVCRTIHETLRAPEHWRSLNLGYMATEDSWRVLWLLARGVAEPGLFSCESVESLALTLQLPAQAPDSLPDFCRALSLFPRLVELDLTGSRVRIGMLHSAFKSCGHSLRRLDLTQVAFLVGHSSNYFIGEAFSPNGAAPDLFEPLAALQVLVARDAERRLDTSRDPHTQPVGRGMLWAAQRCCPALEEMVLGWSSEFGPRASPQAATEFSGLIPWATQHTVEAEGSLSRLRVAVFAGHVVLSPGSLLSLCAGAPPLETLDISNCQSLPDALLANCLPHVAGTLRSLNVRATKFGDGAAAALAGAGANLARLNASCTDVSGHGLALLSDASDRLHYLDLCYAAKLASADVLGCTRRHGGRLTMLGVGGLTDLSSARLREMLEDSSASMLFLGCGGCDALDGAEALALLAALCPELRSLNLHKVTGCTLAALRTLLSSCPHLRSLDCNEVKFDGEEWSDLSLASELVDQLGTKDAWMALARPYPTYETFYVPSVVRTEHPIVEATAATHVREGLDFDSSHSCTLCAVNK